jgi:DNA-binding response OmpR family regulator
VSPIVPKRVLVVDDEDKILEVLCSYLRREGYEPLPAGNGDEALRLFESERPDLVVLDLMLPGISGEEVCRRLRRESRVPVLMLTAKAAEEERLRGFRLGADDYLTKPFSPRELVARVRALLRRTAREPLPLAGLVRFNRGDLVLDLERRQVLKQDREVILTNTELRLLLTLASHPGRVFSREELIRFALGEDFSGFDRTVDAHVKNLRRKIETDPRHPAYVQTVHGSGYRFGGRSDDG